MTITDNDNLKSLSFDQLVPSNSKYMSKDDVGEEGLVLTIQGFKYETLKSDDGEEDKIILYFVEDVRPMVVNRTNSQLIGVATGAKTAGEAVGKKIIVYNDPTVSFGGKITGGIRIRKIVGKPKPAPIKTGAEPVTDEGIPF